ncbi:hypothetical protein KFL_000490290 [Klebsormidium nitens]|uniref:CENP-V/GFA domain-containing protein n=1 Tax=Klebsormidium nitens TaxID=105231 RepID=A0A0U9HIE4_KLENI|nr:hypothetical protein KFL_000490290 [Klebsormidium nitens]|eukprot:GAQ80239.1 hypothetical protein KFL_000490290 [Klebsormidium nitens]
MASIGGQCLCSAVKFEIHDVEPAIQCYCHCETCRKVRSAPIVPLMLFPIDLPYGFADKEGKFKVTEGADLVTSYNHTHTGPRRAFCKRCGSAVFNCGKWIAIFPSTITSGASFKPECHIHYEDSIMPMRDGLPKYAQGPESQKLEEDSPEKP